MSDDYRTITSKPTPSPNLSSNALIGCRVEKLFFYAIDDDNFPIVYTYVFEWTFSYLMFFLNIVFMLPSQKHAYILQKPSLLDDQSTLQLYLNPLSRTLINFHGILFPITWMYVKMCTWTWLLWICFHLHAGNILKWG